MDVPPGRACQRGIVDHRRGQLTRISIRDAVRADFDRIVVDAAFAGHRIGSLLYDDLFAYAGASAIATITCEYNIDPPNPASQRFHERLGFREIGTHRVANGTERFSLEALEL